MIKLHYFWPSGFAQRMIQIWMMTIMMSWSVAILFKAWPMVCWKFCS